MSTLDNIADKQLLETIVQAMMHTALSNPEIVKVLADTEDAVLCKEDVCKLLGVSTSKLDKMIRAGEWRMACNEGRYFMTRQQYRNQRDLYLKIKKR